MKRIVGLLFIARVASFVRSRSKHRVVVLAVVVSNSQPLGKMVWTRRLLTWLLIAGNMLDPRDYRNASPRTGMRNSAGLSSTF